MILLNWQSAVSIYMTMGASMIARQGFSKYDYELDVVPIKPRLISDLPDD